jgi:two-component system response regulator CpxR
MRPKKVILCVDDNEQELSVLKFILDTNGYRVILANSEAEAVQAFSEVAVDLVLADYSMPRTNGAQLVKRLKQIAPHVPMILLGDPERIGPNDADAVLLKKGCSPLEFLERVKIMAARSRVREKFLTPGETAKVLGTPKGRLAELLEIAKESVA